MTDTPPPPLAGISETAMLTTPNPVISGIPAAKIGAFRHSLWAILALLALGLTTWQWADSRRQFSDMQEVLARAAVERDSASKEILRQAQDQVLALQGRLLALEAKVDGFDELRSQQATLENIYQEVARSRDDWALVDIEQGVTLAAQQLQLAGNVHGAVLALQAADARLAGSHRPQFFSLRRVLGQDLARLRALPPLDMPGISLRLEGVIAAIDRLPLANEARLKPEGRPGAQILPAPGLATASSASFWPALQRLASEFWAEIRGLIRVQRFDRDEPALLAPGQSFFLRENLKLRLLNARLALLARDQSTLRSELKQAQAWIERYFDTRNTAVQSALGELKQLAANEIDIELPTLNASLSAIKGAKTSKERK